MQSTDDFQNNPAENLRYVIDSNRIDLAVFLCDNGYAFADRTLQTTIPLKTDSDFQKFCRIPLEKINQPSSRIDDIACNSFLADSRFFLTFPPNKEDQIILIRDYVNQMKPFYICKYKDEIIGFIELIETDEKTAEIRFAAVDEKYRRTGAAMSLYAGSANLYRQKGYKKLIGRISSKNVAVMNVYASLGATFSNSKDIYMKR